MQQLCSHIKCASLAGCNISCTEFLTGFKLLCFYKIAIVAFLFSNPVFFPASLKASCHECIPVFHKPSAVSPFLSTCLESDETIELIDYGNFIDSFIVNKTVTSRPLSWKQSDEKGEPPRPGGKGRQRRSLGAS